MTLAIIHSRAAFGIHAPLVTVEVHLSKGMPRVNIVGLPEAAVKESKDRVRSALLNTAFEFPRGRLTISLAPADLPKEGARFDLAIALGILVASRQIKPVLPLSQYEFIGELALSGELRAVRGILPVVLAGARDKRILIVPAANEKEAALLKKTDVFSADHLLDVCAYLQGKMELLACISNFSETHEKTTLDLSEIRGQVHAKKALIIAATGRHNILFIGPPGTGKTMLASRMVSILPDLENQKAEEIAAIYSVSRQGFDPKDWKKIPFRSPHHSSSSIALVGGGRPPRPGEISLSHHGILFLDELTEFNRHVLDALRESLESGYITISRASYQEVFPARFQFVGAMNPCPCGYAGAKEGYCHCTNEQVQRYLSKISGPLMDRIDLHVEVPRLPPEILAMEVAKKDESKCVKEKVLEARARQIARQGKLNQDLMIEELEQYCVLTSRLKNMLNTVIQKFNLSARSYHRILKVARTIADLAQSDAILEAHLSEAMIYRSLDKTRYLS